ncbi:MAG TPA: ABC transporter permease [Treponemataceae bacterium]|jgi:putative ABC transport system permease protein|nr:MAG: ribose ABC transporter permease protein [Spirochaetes bacterium ADurb.Bin215]HOF86196.1 ABC transporter permease [Treponemataceae bacterium]HOS35422.1 ABC transporter permease [Treponemataceae bacterium]HOU38008.1 ABC transporter permease [Treponemataceae bacterium]HPA10984.1 ABC transporter permease [Treponemataceae bacterium]
MIQGIVIEGLVFGIMALGVFITFRVLDFADLTVDGSFPLGSAVMAMLLTAGVNPFFAMVAAFAAGGVAGAVTAVIHSKLKIPGLLAGILTMTMLHSVNLRIMGNRANVSLLRVDTLFRSISDYASSFMPGEYGILLFLALFTLIVLVATNLFFHTDFGITVGALGSNQQMITSQGMNPEVIKLLGVSLSNGLVGVSGALAAMYQGFADVNAGTGTVVAGLASVMIGEFLLRSNKIELLTLRVILGSILYRAIMFSGRQYGYLINLTANDLKLITGVLIIGCLVISKYGNGRLFSRKGKKA